MSDQGFLNPQLEQVACKNKRLSIVVTINGSGTAANIIGYSNANVGAQVWMALASLTAPTDANFSGLTSTAAPSIIGMYITDGGGQVKKLGRVDIPVNSIRSASMTAGVVTNKGATSAIAGNTGVTASGNAAFQISCTGANFNVALNHEFVVDVEYDVL